MAAVWSDWRNRGLIFRETMLGLAWLLMTLVAGVFVKLFGGNAGLAAMTLAAVLCLAGASAAMAVCHLLRKPRQALASLFFGTILRLGIPLAPGLIFHLHGGLLAEAGLLYYLLLFYPLTLAAGTILSLPAVPRATPRGPAASNTAP